jgi:DNA-directed RNA polymerase specialized sigma24 family protein
MRRDDLFAFGEFMDRFRHVAWNEARGLGVHSAIRRSWTEEVLHDCALALTRTGARVPGSVAGYVVVAVRHRLFDERARNESDERLRIAYAEHMGRSDTSEPAELAEPLTRLAKVLESLITEDEEALLEWKRRKIGYTQAAMWLGVKRDTVAHRTLRLTARLQRAAQELLESLSDEEIHEIRRFMNGLKRGDI